MAQTTENHIKPGVFRYLAVLTYDALLVLSILVLASAIAVGFNAIINHGDAIQPGNPFFFLYLMSVCFLYYGWFWTHGGQTLGMRSWKVYLIYGTNPHISWRQALVRFLTAIMSWLPIGLGFFWLYFGKDNKSWHDSLSGTHLHFSPQAKIKPLSRLS